MACGNRRESRCPPCSERYRRDAYFLVAAGLAGNEEKGVSTDGRLAPARLRDVYGAVVRGGASRVVYAKRSAPRAGRRTVGSLRAWPLDWAVWSVTPQGDPRIGQALCPDCYDYEAAALWNANLGALWRRTITYLPRELAALSATERRSTAKPGPCRLRQGRRVSGSRHRCTSMRSSGSTDPTVPTPRRRAERRRSV